MNFTLILQYPKIISVSSGMLNLITLNFIDINEEDKLKMCHNKGYYMQLQLQSVNKFNYNPVILFHQVLL